jgi:hypothetical protein
MLLFALLLTSGTFLSQRSDTLPEAFAQLWMMAGKAYRPPIQDLLRCCGFTYTTDRASESAFCPVTIDADYTDVNGVEACLPKFERVVMGNDAKNFVIVLFCLTAFTAFVMFLSTAWLADLEPRVPKQNRTRNTAANSDSNDEVYASTSVLFTAETTED